MTLRRPIRKPTLKMIIPLLAAAVLLSGYICYQAYCITEAYAITADGKTILYVKDKEAAENVIKNVVEDYTPEGVTVNKITTDRKLGIAEKKIRKVQHRVYSEKAATNRILAENASEEPAFEIALDASSQKTETVERDVKEVEDDELFEDTRALQEEGEDGEALVTMDLDIVNGTTVSRTEAERDIIKAPQAKIIATGTRSLPDLETTRYRDESDQVIGSQYSEGTKIAEYACKYVGMRYVWGGASLTSGADCSGFMMAVYRKFGYPMTRRGFTSMGTRVSNPQAGDIVYYRGHVAIYIGGGKVVHELNRSRGCVISSVNLCGRHSYWRVAKEAPSKKQ